MTEIAEGNDDVEIAGLDRRDEIGEMARATEIFRTNISALEALSGKEDKERALTSEINALLDQKHAVEEQVSALTEEARNLTLARDAAEAASRAKSDILAAVSYDVRTPMNGLIGMAGLMNDTDLSEKQRDYVAGIEQSGKALLAVFNDLLDYSSLEAGQLVLESAEFDILEMLESLHGLLRSDVDREGLKIVCCVGQDVPQFVCGDRNRLTQAMLYLLSAALKAPDKGVVSVEVTAQQLETAYSVLRFDFISHGQALTAQSAEEFIRRAWSEKPYPARVGARPALGLTICECLAALMGGRFGHDQDNTDGHRYWFTARLDAVEFAPQDWRAPSAQLFGKRALVVHGNHASRNILCRQMQGWGLKAEQATDGRTALARMARVEADGSHVDFVVVDRNLEDMNVLAFLRAMRTAVESDALRAVLVCQSGDAPDEVQMRSLGVAACLEGVLYPRQLLESLVGPPGHVLRGAPEVGMAEPPEEPTEADDAGEKIRILIADDNQMNQRLVAAMLNTPAYHVDLVGNGAEALAAVKSVPYHLVLMDIQMPEMDGVEATEEIRRLPGDVAKIPIVAITAYAMEGDREKYLSAGMDDYIAKPIEKDDLIEIIERLTRVSPNALPGSGEPETVSGDETAEPDEAPEPPVERADDPTEEEEDPSNPPEAASGD